MFAFVLLVSNTTGVFAQAPGSLDPTFNGTGKVVWDKDQFDLYQDVKVQPDGKIVAVGTYMTATYTSGIEVTRFLTDGSFDPDFGDGGHFNIALNIESGAYKCIIKDDGNILVGGYTTDYTMYEMLLFQLKTNGTLDSVFGDNGIVLTDLGQGEDMIYALAIQDNGKILAAGYSQNADYRNAPVIVRYSSTGILDPTFGTDGIATVPVTEIDNDFSAISIQSDGKIVAAGHISNGMSWFSLLIARFDHDGIIDPTYGSGGVVNMNLNNIDDEFYDMQLTDNDESVLTGFTVSQGDLYYHLLVMKFDVNGQPDPNFGSEGVVTYGDVPYTFGDAMAMQADGKILVAGCTGNLLPGDNDWAVWRFNPDGTPDADFGTAGVVTTDFFGNADEALGIALYLDKIIVAGKTRNATNYLDFAVTRYVNDFNVSVPASKEVQKLSVMPDPVKENGTVTVSFNLAEAGNVSIALTDMTGRTVLQLTAGIRSSGNNTFSFSLPSEITSGVYFLRVSGPKQAFTSPKLIVIN